MTVQSARREPLATRSDLRRRREREADRVFGHAHSKPRPPPIATPTLANSMNANRSTQEVVSRCTTSQLPYQKAAIIPPRRPGGPHFRLRRDSGSRKVTNRPMRNVRSLTTLLPLEAQLLGRCSLSQHGIGVPPYPPPLDVASTPIMAAKKPEPLRPTRGQSTILRHQLPRADCARQVR